ncbi:MAG TPA: TlpA disulfide reductase family protein [Chitinophagaceae bacterium]|nr:TlpA disulfide reductase family protein [Chitinophagaceae bacterium]
MLFDKIKKLTLILGLCIVSTTIYPQNSVIIDGRAPYLYDGVKIHIKSLYPYKPVFNYPVIEDSTIISNHEFKLNLTVPSAESYVIELIQHDKTFSNVIFLQNGSCSMILADSTLQDIEIYRNQAGIDQNNFKKMLDKIKVPQAYFDVRKKYKESLQTKDSILSDKLLKRTDSIENEFKIMQQNAVYDWIKLNPSSVINSKLIMAYLLNNYKDDLLGDIFYSLAPMARDNSWGKELHYYFSNLICGKKFPSFILKDTSGNSLSLGDFKGKYLLLDFWASWCVPCRMQNKELMRVYKKYKGNDLEFIYISLDKINEDWKKAIQKDAVNCINLSDLDGFEGISRQYMFRSIPRNFLLDKKGLIIAKNIETEDLERYMKKNIHR